MKGVLQIKKRTNALINSSLLIVYIIFVIISIVEHGFNTLELFVYLMIAIGIQVVWINKDDLKSGLKQIFKD